MRLVVDASVALKWVISETDSPEATHLLSARQLLAPDLILAEISNALWKRVRRGEIAVETALIAAKVVGQAPVQLMPMCGLLVEGTRMAMALDHPAYDCFYLALAAQEDCPLVTADVKLARRIAAMPESTFSVLSLAEAATLVGRPRDPGG